MLDNIDTVITDVIDSTDYLDTDNLSENTDICDVLMDLCKYDCPQLTASVVDLMLVLAKPVLAKPHTNSCFFQTARATSLETMRNKVYELELEGRKPHEEDTPETRKIRVLENRLDKAMIKYNEAQSIRKTYEQIVKRLGEERIGFDNQLVAIERTLAAKQHDYEELLLLSGDANHARDMAQTELDRVRNTYQRTKDSRERNLRERHDVAQIKAGMNARLAEREKVRSDIMAQAMGDMSEQQEQTMKRSLAMNRMSSNKIREETREQKKKGRRSTTVNKREYDEHCSVPEPYVGETPVLRPSPRKRAKMKEDEVPIIPSGNQ